MDLHTTAAWVAAISIIMVMIKLAGLWRVRRRIAARLGRSSGSCLGNKIFLHNLTRRPLSVIGWRIYVVEGLLHQQEVKEVTCFDGRAGGIVIEPRCSHILFFFDEGLFNRSADLREGQRLYIGIETADGRVSTCCLYPGNHPWPALQALLAVGRGRQKRLARE